MWDASEATPTAPAQDERWVSVRWQEGRTTLTGAFEEASRKWRELEFLGFCCLARGWWRKPWRRVQQPRRGEKGKRDGSVMFLRSPLGPEMVWIWHEGFRVPGWWGGCTGNRKAKSDVCYLQANTTQTSEWCLLSCDYRNAGQPSEPAPDTMRRESSVMTFK